MYIIYYYIFLKEFKNSLLTVAFCYVKIIILIMYIYALVLSFAVGAKTKKEYMT